MKHSAVASKISYWRPWSLLRETATVAGIILFVAGVVYTLTSTIIGHRLDKTNNTKAIVITGAVSMTILISVGFTLSFIQHTVSMPGIAGYVILIPLATCMIYLPIFKIMKETAISHGITDGQQLNAVLNNFLITSIIIGQLIGTGTAGVMYQYLRFKWSCLCWIIISLFLTICFAIAIRQNRPVLRNENKRFVHEQDDNAS